jgi:hypothetical protein
MQEQSKNATYLGDGLYADHDGFQIRLYASNGIETTNEVFLEPPVLGAFLKYLERVKNWSVVVTPNKIQREAVSQV